MTRSPARRAPGSSAVERAGLRRAVTVMALFALGAAGCSANARAGPNAAQGLHAPISASKAAAVLGSTMAINNKANATFDMSLLRTYESGSALAIDGAQYTMSELAKKLGTKPSPYVPFTIHPLQVVVGAGGSYPAGFLGVGSTYLEEPEKTAGTCPHADTLLEYEKLSASSPWRIVLEPTANEGPFATLASDHGIAVLVSATERAAADRVPQQVATDLQDYEVTGRLGPFSSSDFNGKCWAIPDPRSELRQAEATGLSDRELYQPAGGTVAYLIAGASGGGTPGSASTSAPKSSPGVLVLFTLDFVDQLFAGGGSPIDWTAQPATDPASVLLPSGHYSSVTERGALELAAELGGDGKFSIVGEYAGITSVAGTRSKAGSGGGTLVEARLG